MDPVHIRFAVYAIVGPLVSTVGIVGNCLILLILWNSDRQDQNNSGQNTNTNNSRGYMYGYIRGLALADLGYLLFNLQACYFCAHDLNSNEYESWYVYIFSIMQPSWNAFKSASDFIVVCMTVDRYRVIGHIEQVRLTAMRRADDRKYYVLAQILGSFVLSFGLHLPYYFKYDGRGCNWIGLNASNISVDNNTYWPCDNDGPESDLWTIYNVIYCAAVKVLPVLIVVILNVILCKRLRVIWKRRQRLRQQSDHVGSNLCNRGQTRVVQFGGGDNVSMSTTTTNNDEVQQKRRKTWSLTSNKSLREQQMATLILCIAVAFVALTAPANGTYIYYMLHTELYSYSTTAFLLLISITNILENVNYSINFYLYCVANGEIRNIVLDYMHAFAARFRNVTTTLCSINNS